MGRVEMHSNQADENNLEHEEEREMEEAMFLSPAYISSPWAGSF